MTLITVLNSLSFLLYGRSSIIGFFDLWLRLAYMFKNPQDPVSWSCFLYFHFKVLWFVFNIKWFTYLKLIAVYGERYGSSVIFSMFNCQHLFKSLCFPYWWSIIPTLWYIKYLFYCEFFSRFYYVQLVSLSIHRTLSYYLNYYP